MPTISGSIGTSSSSYYEYWTRRTAETPKGLRDIGVFLDLPYSFEKGGQRQNFSKLLWSGDPTWNVFSPVSIVSVGMSPQYTVTPSYPDEGAVIEKLANKWRNTDLNIGMYLSPEGRESAETMIHGMTRLASTARDLKRGNIGAALRNLDHLPTRAKRRVNRRFEQGDISGAFLSAHLGWEPIIKDIYEASNLVSPVESGDRIRASKLGNPGVRVVKGPFGQPFPGTESHSDKLSISLIGDVRRPPTFQERFGLSNALSIAWELVPLSFVADYFLPVGRTIDNMYFISQVRFSKLWMKRYRLSSAEVSVPKNSFYSTYNYRRFYNASDMFYVSRYREFERKPHQLSFTDPLRSISVTVPSSLMRLGTMTALLHQRILSLDSKRR